MKPNGPTDVYEVHYFCGVCQDRKTLRLNVAQGSTMIPDQTWLCVNGHDAAPMAKTQPKKIEASAIVMPTLVPPADVRGR